RCSPSARCSVHAAPLAARRSASSPSGRRCRRLEKGAQRVLAARLPQALEREQTETGARRQQCDRGGAEDVVMLDEELLARLALSGGGDIGQLDIDEAASGDERAARGQHGDRILDMLEDLVEADEIERVALIGERTKIAGQRGDAD